MSTLPKVDAVALESQDIVSVIATHIDDIPTLAAFSAADKTAHEVAAPAVAEARYSVLMPTTVKRDCEPHLWGACGPRNPGHGIVVASQHAMIDMAADEFASADLKLDCVYEAENDEGDYDQYFSHTLAYKGEAIWKLSTSAHSNIGGTWGTSSSCRIVGQVDLNVSLTHCGRMVGGGHDSFEVRTYSVKEILIGAAVKAGAKPPIKPGDVKLV
mmetsp:Transcript_27295/g.69443  ORF Transcript_27295/g.69443 Transcript_27295/m.69443 type:complete len:214 (-) Transcript_27295:352-993(-)|eukprot:CAMPEP_0115832654 /NCGR_PEP_ID=MMETSP0287-20121206/2770_1 /TAXON_ID=412157 /ORGANISM="Chrysochromulina rotalis, Strain UIO044" /LENGTH=213 /DNA_ID=CAMNT_0003286047 /DNA_START=77 /DNA_END=718 /DNA_ORIENTATION=-